MKKNILIAILNSLILITFAQKNLIDQYNKEHNIEQKFSIVKQIVENTPGKISRDTTEQILKNFIELCQKSYEKKSSDTILPYFIAKSYSFWGLIYSDDLEKKASFLEKSLKILEKTNLYNFIALTHFDLGIIYRDIEKFDKSIEQFYNALKYYEKLDSLDKMATIYLNLGKCYHSMTEYDKALINYRKALVFYQQKNFPKSLSAIYNNIGLIFKTKGQIDSAIYYYNKAIEIRKNINDYKGLASTYNNLGVIYKNKGDISNAMHYLKLSLAYSKKLKDKYGEAIALGNIGETYRVWYEKTKSPQYLKIAIKYMEQTANIADSLKSYVLLSAAFENLMLLYEYNKDYQKSAKIAKIWNYLKDSLYNQEKIKIATEAEKKFEAEKKQFIIERLEKEKALKEETLKRKNLQSRLQAIAIIALFAIVILTLFFAYSLKKLNKKLEQANIIIQQQNEELKTALDEIKTQNELLNKQKDLLQSQYKKINDSINYALRIQNALLPSKEDLQSIFKDYYLIYKPKDIVSGDFYWTYTYDNIKYLAIADCTGHGVPGAFMSILGIAFLKDLISKEIPTSPAYILNTLRKEIISALKQTSDINSQSDGMDISLLVINNDKIYWSGANLPLAIYKKNEKNLETLPPNKMPVSYFIKIEPFNEIELKINKDDRIFMFTDGFYSQFGGENNEKLYIRRFFNLIKDLYTDNLKTHGRNLENYLIQWEQDQAQTDDITLLIFEI